MSRKIDHKISSFFLAGSDCNPGDKKVREEVLMLKKTSTDDFRFKSCILRESAGLLTLGRSLCFPRESFLSAQIQRFHLPNVHSEINPQVNDYG
jgi:hypothetical protein